MAAEYKLTFTGSLEQCKAIKAFAKTMGATCRIDIRNLEFVITTMNPLQLAIESLFVKHSTSKKEMLMSGDEVCEYIKSKGYAGEISSTAVGRELTKLAFLKKSSKIAEGLYKPKYVLYEK